MFLELIKLLILFLELDLLNQNISLLSIKRIGDEFVLIPTLGSFGVDEYTFNNNQELLLNQQLVQEIWLVEAKIEKAIESTGTP